MPYLLLLLLVLTGCATPPKANIIEYEYAREDYARLQKIARLVLPMMDLENQHKYNLSIVSSHEINAWMVQGDDLYNICFTPGLLWKFKDPELTYIFAHEVAHVKLGHVAKRTAAAWGTWGAFTVLGVF